MSVSDRILEYIIALCQVSREASTKAKPLSPRAGKALLGAAKSWAFMDNRDYVLPEDVQAVFTAVCLHRMELDDADFSYNNNDLKSNNVASFILQQVDVLEPLSVS